MSRAQAREAQRIGEQAELDRQLLPTNAESNRLARRLRAENTRRTLAASVR